MSVLLTLNFNQHFTLSTFLQEAFLYYQICSLEAIFSQHKVKAFRQAQDERSAWNLHRLLYIHLQNEKSLNCMIFGYYLKCATNYICCLIVFGTRFFTGTTANLTVDAFLMRETSDQIQQNENIELNVNNNMKELNAHTGIFRIWWTYLGRRYNRRLFLNRVCNRYLWCSVFIQRDMVRHAVRMLAVR